MYSLGIKTLKRKTDLLIIHPHDLIMDLKHFYLVVIYDWLIFKIKVMQLMTHKT